MGIASFDAGDVISYSYSINVVGGDFGARINFQVLGSPISNLVGNGATNGYTSTSGSGSYVAPANLSRLLFAATSGGGAGSGSVSFLLSCNAAVPAAAAPTVTSLSQSVGSPAGGTSVTIIGSDFTGATSVSFGGTAATFTVDNASQITAVAPAHAAGTVDVTVTTPNGTGTRPASFTYAAPLPSAPTISSVAPSSGSPAGGTHVILTGTDFTGATAVSFGGTAAASFTINSATRITADTPGHVPGLVDVSVITPGGSGTITNGYTYTAAIAVSPNAGTLSAGTVGTTYNQTISASGGTPGYTYAVISGALPSGLTLGASSGALSGVPTTRGSYSFTVAATDSAMPASTGMAAYTLDVNAIVPDAPTIGSVHAGDGQASVLFGAPTSDGGSPLTSYTVTSNPGSIAATGSVSPITIVGLTNGTAYTFSVTATNGAGTGPASAFSNAVTPLQTPPALSAPIGNDSTSTVAANSSSNTISLNLAGGMATSVSLAGLPSHGTASASGAAITYTPFGGYSGTDSFTYTAANASGTSAPATVTIIVSTPNITFSPAAGPLSAGIVGLAYGQNVSASGGAAPYAYAVTSGMLPPGLALASTGIISGTTTTAGSASFDITATDRYGAVGTVSYFITVNPAPFVSLAFSPPPGATLAAGTVGRPYPGASVSVTGGTTTVTYSASGLPPGLSMNATTGALSGQPAAAGYFSATVVATDGAAPANTGSATYALEVAAAPGPLVIAPPAGALPKATAGKAYRQHMSVSGGTGTMSYRVVSGALPSGLVLDASTGELSGSLKTDAEGVYSFTVMATDGNGTTGLASYSLEVETPGVTVTDKTVVVAAGQMPENVDLNAGATGDPFIRADLSFVEPPTAGTALIVEDEVTVPGMSKAKRFYLAFAPNPLFSGTARVGFTLSSDVGVSNVGIVSYSVTRDMAAVVEQADRAVRDFVGARQSLLSSHVRAPGILDRRVARQANERVGVAITPNGNGLGVSMATSTTQMEAARRANVNAPTERSMPRTNAWIDGIFLMREDGGTSAPPNHPFETGRRGDGNHGWGSFALLSIGVDYLVTDRILVGVALHADRMTDPNESTDVEGSGLLAGPYASIELSPGLFLDASLLYGHSWNNIDMSSFDGSFDTTRFMATTKLEGLLEYGAITLRPSLKLNYVAERIADYDVSSHVERAPVKGFTEDDLRFSAGLKAVYSVELADGWAILPEVEGSLGISSTAGSDVAGGGPFGTVEAGFTIASRDEWSLRTVGTADLGERGTSALGGRIGLVVPF